MLEEWDNSYNDNPTVINKIKGSAKLIALYGFWPSFDSAEVISMNFSRGNTLDCIEKNDWNNKTGVRLEVEMVLSETPLDSLRKINCNIQFCFDDIADFAMEGFNYQNPLRSLGVREMYISRLKDNYFRVDWGGAAIRHDVSVVCKYISLVMNKQ